MMVDQDRPNKDGHGADGVLDAVEPSVPDLLQPGPIDNDLTASIDRALTRALEQGIEDDDLVRLDLPRPNRRIPSMLPTPRPQRSKLADAGAQPRRVRLDVGLGLLPFGGTMGGSLAAGRRFWDANAHWGYLSVQADERPTVGDEDLLLAIMHLAQAAVMPTADRGAAHHPPLPGLAARLVQPADADWSELAQRLDHDGQPAVIAEMRIPLPSSRPRSSVSFLVALADLGVALPREAAGNTVMAALERLATVRVVFVAGPAKSAAAEQLDQSTDASAPDTWVDEDGVIHDEPTEAEPIGGNPVTGPDAPPACRITSQRLLHAVLNTDTGALSIVLCWRLARSLDADDGAAGSALVDLADRAALPPSARAVHRYLSCKVRRLHRPFTASKPAQATKRIKGADQDQAAGIRGRRGPRARADGDQPVSVDLDELAAILLGPAPATVADAARAQRLHDSRLRSPKQVAAAQAQAARRRGEFAAAEVFAAAAEAHAQAAAELAARRRRALEAVATIQASLGRAWRITRPASTTAVPKQRQPMAGKNGGPAAGQPHRRQALLAPAVTVSRLA